MNSIFLLFAANRNDKCLPSPPWLHPRTCPLQPDLAFKSRRGQIVEAFQYVLSHGFDDRRAATPGADEADFDVGEEDEAVGFAKNAHARAQRTFGQHRDSEAGQHRGDKDSGGPGREENAMLPLHVGQGF